MSARLTPENRSETPAIDRSALRRQLVERRLALSKDDWARLSTAICEQVRENFPRLSEMRVGFCWPIKNEPDLRPLVLSWIESGKDGFAALLPVVVGADAPLAFRAWTPDRQMMTDRYGIPTPAVGEFLMPEALLIPVNAFDAHGYRIGYGGGFFDRTLAALKPAPLCIGVGFELARVDSIRPEAHDVRLDAMVTEAGVFRHD
jgi:5,10-methenyltetrahydrofolate synthetase